jgi:hypothetical protein
LDYSGPKNPRSTTGSSSSGVNRDSEPGGWNRPPPRRSPGLAARPFPNRPSRNRPPRWKIPTAWPWPRNPTKRRSRKPRKFHPKKAARKTVAGIPPSATAISKAPKPGPWAAWGRPLKSAGSAPAEEEAGRNSSPLSGMASWSTNAFGKPGTGRTPAPGNARWGLPF